MEILESGPLLLGVVFIGFFGVTLFVRRWFASRRNGGSFFSPYHFEWHLLHSCVFVLQPSYDPIERDEADNPFIARGRAGGGSRYAFYIELRNGKTIPSFW